MSMSEQAQGIDRMQRRLKSLRVLVVDDLAIMRDLLRGILYSVGVGVVETANEGGAAFAQFIQSPADVIFVDWQMHPMTGIEFVQAVRRSSQSPNPYVPIIMVTGHANREHIVQAREAGVHEYLVKPITAQSVLSRLAEVINHPRKFIRTGEYFGPAPRERFADQAGGGRNR